MTQRPVPKRPKEGAADGSFLRGRRILVVEDDLFFQEYVSDLLAREGADVVRAQDGETGLALAVSGRPELILTDVEIPRLQGFELLRTLRSRAETAAIPVLMMSGKVDREVFERLAQSRISPDGYLVKPFSAQELFAALRKALAPAGKGEPSSPLVPAPGRPRPDGALVNPSSRAPRILVVDDSAHIRAMVGDFLREGGAEVLESADGKAGLARAIETLPDAVLLDVQMPHLNGFVVCELLKKAPETAHIPVIIMSAVADEETFRKHSKLKNRADAYLLKPFKKGDLIALLGRLTGSRSFSSPAQRVEERAGFLLPPAAAPSAASAPSAPPARSARPASPKPDPRAASEPGRKAGPAAGPKAPEGQADLFHAGEKALRDENASLASEIEHLREEGRRNAAVAEERRQELTEKLSLALKRLEDLAAAGEKGESDAARLQGQIKALEAGKRSATEELEKVKKLAANEAALRREVEGQLKAAAAERDKAVSAHTQVEAATQKMSSKAGELEKKMDALQLEAVSARKMAAQETSVRMESESRLVSAQQEKDQLGKEVAALRQRVAAAESLQTRTTTEVQALRDSLARADAAVKEKEAHVASRSASDEKARSALEKEKAALKDELAVAARRTAEAEALALRLKEKEAALREAEAAAAQKGALLEKAEAGLARLKDEADLLRKERSLGEKEKESFRNGVLQEKVAAEKELEALGVKCAALEKGKAEAVARVAALDEELAASRRDSERAHAGLGETEKKALAREDELRREQAARRKADDELLAARKAADDAGHQKTILEGALKGEQDKVAAAQKEMAALKERLALLEKKELDLSASLSSEERKGRELVLEVEKGKAARGQIESTLLETRKKLDEAAAARNALEKSLAETRSRHDEAARGRESQDKALAGANRSLEEAARSRATLEKSLAAETSRLAASAEQAKKHLAEIEALRKTLAASGEKGGKIEAALKDHEQKSRALAGELEKEKISRTAAENALREARKETERLTGERDKREAALRAETARVGKEKDEVGKRLEASLVEGRKLAEKGKELEAQVAQAQETERTAAAALARGRGVVETALHQAQGLLATPAGGREGLEALVRSLHISLEKEAPADKGRKAAGAPGGSGKALALGGVAAGLLVGVLAGYLVFPRMTGAPGASTGSSASVAGASEADGASQGGAPIEDSPALMEYAKSWSRLTVEAPGEDIRVQATIHSAIEVELAVRLIAQKDGWPEKKLQAALSDASRVMNGGEYLYATILVKAGTAAAPSAGDLQDRLVVKDPWGKTVSAVDPVKSLGKVLTEAVRAPNPDYSSGTGVTVAFPRKGLRLEAKTLELGIAPTGSEPGRFLKWDLSAWGG